MIEETVYRYYSNGKLLITGEYLVLQGALALSVPTRRGQVLYIHRIPGQKHLKWDASVLGEPWFSCTISPGDWTISTSGFGQSGTDHEALGKRLLNILKAASILKEDTEWLLDTHAVSEIGFEIGWGLGSSSSLISNIAAWADVDAFRLFRLVSSGSGYDLASARTNKPILYRSESPSPEIREVEFHPGFADKLAFVYLGKKQDSTESVRKFLANALVREKDLEQVSGISEKIVSSDSLEEYKELLTEHEKLLSGILDRPSIKEVLFRDYPGLVKSLGAWGGDFIHVSLDDGIDTAKDYFRGKGLDVIIPYHEMVIPKDERSAT